VDPVVVVVVVLWICDPPPSLESDPARSGWQWLSFFKIFCAALITVQRDLSKCSRSSALRKNTKEAEGSKRSSASIGDTVEI